MCAKCVAHFSESHLYSHADLALVRVAVNHIELTPTASFKIDDRGCSRRIYAAPQKVMAEAGYLALFIRKSIGLKMVFGMAFEADMRAGR